MILDCHFHIDEEMHPLDRLIEAMDRNGIQKTALIAKHCNQFYLQHDSKSEKLAELFKNLLLNVNPLGKKIYKTFVDGKGNFIVLGNKVEIQLKPDNEKVFKAIKKYPGRFLGWVTINPVQQVDVLEEIEKYSAIPEMVGVKTHPFFHRYNIELLDTVAGICQDRNYPLLIHLSGQKDCYRYLPEKYPRLKIIYAHAGIPHFRKLWAYAAGMKNVYIDLSSDYLNEYIIELAVKAMGSEKCLYGTDGPYGIAKPGDTYDYSKMKGWIERLRINDRQKKDILGDNFIRLIS